MFIIFPAPRSLRAFEKAKKEGSRRVRRFREDFLKNDESFPCNYSLVLLLLYSYSPETTLVSKLIQSRRCRRWQNAMFAERAYPLVSRSVIPTDALTVHGSPTLSVSRSSWTARPSMSTFAPVACAAVRLPAQYKFAYKPRRPLPAADKRA